MSTPGADPLNFFIGIPEGTARVTRSPLVNSGTLIQVGGQIASDGKSRIFVPESTSDELIDELTLALEEHDRLTVKVEAVLAVIRGTTPVEQ